MYICGISLLSKPGATYVWCVDCVSFTNKTSLPREMDGCTSVGRERKLVQYSMFAPCDASDGRLQPLFSFLPRVFHCWTFVINNQQHTPYRRIFVQYVPSTSIDHWGKRWPPGLLVRRRRRMKAERPRPLCHTSSHHTNCIPCLHFSSCPLYCMDSCWPQTAKNARQPAPFLCPLFLDGRFADGRFAGMITRRTRSTPCVFSHNVHCGRVHV